MKKILFVVFLFSIAKLQGQIGVGTVRVGNDTFTINKTLETTEYTDEPIHKVIFYKKRTKLLTHIVKAVDGDDNSTAIELGTYETTDSSITFFSYWARAGDAPVSPFGVRKQVYKIMATGRLYLATSEMYIEATRQGWEENKGIEYLFKPPKTSAQRKLLVAYIMEVEKKYNAHFVFGGKADTLFRVVKGKLKKEINEETKDWNKIEAYKAFGYKR